MLELTSLSSLNFPVMRVSVPHNLKVKVLTHNSLRIGTKVLDASAITKCTFKSNNTKLITGVSSFFDIPSTVAKNLVLLVDFQNKRIFRCVRSIHFRIEYKLIMEVSDYHIRVDTIPHPIRHNDPALQQEGVDRLLLYARIANVGGILYFVGTNHIKEKNYNVKI